MSSKRKSMQKPYVVHPRYGDKPTCSGESHSVEEILSSHWSYRRESIFPESAIAADTTKQNYSLYPRTIYVDIEKRCAACGRWFIFFAKEQKYWFESLGFYIDADCAKCIDCRKKEQEVRVQMNQYAQLVKKKDLTEEEVRSLKRVALELFQKGYIKDKRKIDSIG